MLNKREMRLGLRHRDSFAVHKSHLHQAPPGVSLHAHSGPGAGAGAGAGGASSSGGLARSNSAEGPAFLRGAHHQSSMSELFDGISSASAASSSASPRKEGDDADLDEGGPDSDDAMVSVNPNDEDDILKALEGLGLGGEGDGVGRGGRGGGGVGAAPGSPEEAAEQSEEQARKKNKLRSMIKGVGSALGLRKSKKKRMAEAAAATGGGGGGDPSGAAGGAPPQGGLLRKMFRSRSSPSLGDDDKLQGGSSAQSPPGTPVQKGASGRGGVGFAPSSQSVVDGPNRDDNGMYLPNHRRDVTPHPAIKSPNPTTGRPGKDWSAQAAGMQPPSKRRISYVDIHRGEPLIVVHYVEDLHYSENAEHVDWDEEDDQGKCSIM
jgi:hypothetical protein